MVSLRMPPTFIVATLAIAVLAAGTYAFRLAGPMFRHRIRIPDRLQADPPHAVLPLVDHLGAHALVAQLLHRLPGVDEGVLLRHRPVDEVEVDVLHLEAMKTVSQGALGLVEAVVVVEALGRDEDVASRQRAPCKRCSDALLAHSLTLDACWPTTPS